MTNSTPSPAPVKPRAGLKVVILVGLVVAVVAAAVNAYRQWPRDTKYQRGGPGEIRFVDHAQSNAPLTADIGSLQFVDAAGKPVDLQKYRGQKNLVLVVTRGQTKGGPAGYYIESVCIYCSTQTSRLVANYDAIKKHDAEVVVVFPVKQASETHELGKFQDVVVQTGKLQSPPPFPLVLDPGLKAVDQLGIREDLAKPATYILDREGEVRFAYVGRTIADRPSVQSILEQLELLSAEQKAAGS